MKIIKNILIVLTMIVMVTTSGCFSPYNHNRVKENMIKEEIYAKGNTEQVKALNSGIRPSSVIKIIPTTDARGAYVAMDLWNPDNITYFKTFAEAPVSSTLSLLGDGGLLTGVIYLGAKLVDGKNKDETNVNVNNDGTTAVNVRSDGNKTDVKTGGNGGGTTVINIDSDGNRTTVDNSTPPNTP